MDRVTGRSAAVAVAASAQLTGVREGQEDALAMHVPVADSGARAGEVLLALADGMGGHACGEVASRLVVESFCSAYRDSVGKVADALRGSLDLANESLAELIASEPRLAGMGTTLVGCVIQGDGLHWISVGDSLLWVCRGGALQRINADHSMLPLLELMVSAGELTREELQKDPRRNMLRSALTGRAIALIDLCDKPFQLEAGDIIMLASDGVVTLTDDQLVAVLQNTRDKSLQELADNLMSSIEAAGHSNQDNASVILYRH